MTTLCILLSLPFIHFHPSQGVKNIGGVSCRAQGPIVYYPSGKLKSCVLASPHLIAGNKCIEGGVFKLYESGKLEECVFSTVTRWNTVYPVVCSERATVTLYEKGTAQRCVLAETFQRQEIRCQKGTWINLYEDGKVMSCRQE